MLSVEKSPYALPDLFPYVIKDQPEGNSYVIGERPVFFSHRTV